MIIYIDTPYQTIYIINLSATNESLLQILQLQPRMSVYKYLISEQKRSVDARCMVYLIFKYLI